MKILLVLHGFPPQTRGGSERAVEALARAMRAAGHDARVAAGALDLGRPDAVAREDLDGLPVLRLRRDDLYHDSWLKAHSPAVSAAFERLLREERPDVVHVHHWIRTTTDLVRLARAAGCIAAVTLHDYFSVLATPIRRFGDDVPAPPAVPGYVGAAEAAEAFALHRRDLYAEVCAAHVRCAPSRAHAEGVQQMAPGPLGRIEVTPPPLLQVPRRRAAAGGPRGRRLVTWGSLYADKGLEVVLDALRLLGERRGSSASSGPGAPGGPSVPSASSHPRAPSVPRGPGSEGLGATREAGGGYELEVWGAAHEAAYDARLRERARGLPVRFRGAFTLADLEATAADYAVLASTCHESYGLTLDEAQCLGLPVLASDLPAYREHAPPGASALFAPGDAAALAALLADRERLARLAAPPAPPVVTPPAAAAQLVELYERARRGEAAAITPAAEVAPVTERERTEAAFRRAERRLWSALQGGPPPAPPDDFLGRGG